MRIMIDTNILISALLFPKSLIRELVEEIVVKGQLVLCSYIIEELYEVFKIKFPDEIGALDLFLSELTYELFYTPKRLNPKNYPRIRDENDLPILASAIIGDVDVLITGDKDFYCIDIEKPRIISPKDFKQLY